MQKKIVSVISLILILLASAFIATPVFSKNLNLPSGADVILYYSGGEAVINLPTDPALRINYPASATEMKIGAVHVEIPNLGYDECAITIELYMILPGSTTPIWEPFLFIVTDVFIPDISYWKNIFEGTFAEYPGTQVNPNWVNTDNVKLVSSDALQVVRQGNNIYVNFASQQVQRVNNLYFTIPAFSVELNSYGRSIHTFETTSLTGYVGAPDYTIEKDKMGFNANGAFTSTAWSYNNVPIYDSAVIMHGIDTYYPPAVA